MDESRVSNCEDCPTAAAASHLCSDRLSELPDSLILEILSLLEMKEVVRTTILSKRWKDLWTDITCLDFGFSCQTFVKEALAKWKGAKIFKFTLYFDRSPPSDFLDSCLLIPIEKHVEELYLFGILAPHCLYSCSSITKLDLINCDPKIGENVDVQWNQLKSLTIEVPNNYLSEDALNRILCGAPLLEELILFSSYIKFNIQSSSLKTLQIGRNYYDNGTQIMAEGMLRIWAPNLSSLDISARVYGTCFLDVPSLTTAVICFEEEFDSNDDDRIDNDYPPLEMYDQFFQSLRHVEKLTLSCLSIEFLLDMKGNYMVVPFSKTKYLKLSPNKAEELLHVLGMFPEVKMLVAELDKLPLCTFYDEPHQAMVDACNSLAPKMTYSNPSLLQLKTIEITCYIYDASIIPVVEILLENAHVLEKMVLRLEHGEADEKTFMLAKNKVLSMPRSSPTAQVIISKEW